MTKPYAISELEKGKQSGKSTFVLSLNVDDRQFDSDLSIPPLKLGQYLFSYFARLGFQCGEFSSVSGMQAVMPPDQPPDRSNPFGAFKGEWRNDPARYLSQLLTVLRNPREKLMCLLSFADLKIPAADSNSFLSVEERQVIELLLILASDDQIMTSQNFLLLVDEGGGIHELLTRNGAFRRINVPLPDKNTRGAFISMMEETSKRSDRFCSISENLPLEEFVNLTSGLRLTDIEELYRRNVTDTVVYDHIVEVKARTVDEMAQGLLEVIPASISFDDIAGLTNIKKYMKRLGKKIRSGRNDVPQFIILQGVPGVGKSLTATALARELGFLLVKIGNLKGPYVGQSQRNLERVLTILEQIAPVVALIEEIDQRFQRGTGASGDSGTSEEMFARILDWLGSGNLAGRVLVVGTTNRPDLIPEALWDRTGVIFPYLHPTPEEIKELLPLLAKKYGRILEPNIDLEKLFVLNSMQLVTVRGLTEMVKRAGDFADGEDSDFERPISGHHLEAAIRDYKPNSDPIEMEFIALTTLSLISFQSLVPWYCHCDQAIDMKQLPPYLNGIVDEQGQVDQTKLTERLRRIEEIRFGRRAMR